MTSRSKQAARAGKDITVEVDKPIGLKFKELKGGQGLLVTVSAASWISSISTKYRQHMHLVQPSNHHRPCSLCST